MTTTPDSRIARDFGLTAYEAAALKPGDVRLHDPLGYYAKRDAAEPIDTSTTAGKIAVMQAYERGERIQAITLSGTELEPRSKADEYGCDKVFSWDWSSYNYRIAPPPAPRSALSAARLKVSSGLGQFNSLKALVNEVDASPVVTAFHDPLTDDVCVSHPREKLTPGRYRLLRDEE